jgi:hypothetical protein
MRLSKALFLGGAIFLWTSVARTAELLPIGLQKQLLFDDHTLLPQPRNIRTNKYCIRERQ